ncbi:hypothetical protein AEAC466_10650 [Asticcacaulis sp. AC466]|uniref:hypothetical protein n=1 Tax=Asticcacaulis sp. AC466 TaxID=1282362 RepID=UPI0003C3F98C|nr:hypothetical protein [Asticcacaulis sp. AC466]ESQ84195.1 hypothetical protein AEAC466_10650 [Asticcacaulis sp. AC466]
MHQSKSERQLNSLADRTFLKLWSIPNTFYASGKELTDLIVPFGDDVIIISDKACSFDFEIDRELAWSRWFRHAIEGTVRQLKTALQRIKRQPASIFTDKRATEALRIGMGNPLQKRFHLISVVRPDVDPAKVVPEWPGLTYTSSPDPQVFHIGKMKVSGTFVHVFDGPSFDALLTELDTVSDLLAYLKGREASFESARQFEFKELDLLGASQIGWVDDPAPTGLPSVPPLEAVVPGLWEMYVAGETKRRRDRSNRGSRVIDAYIASEIEEYRNDRVVSDIPSFDSHEQTLRLLAGESRLARRIIALQLNGILEEKDLSTFWSATCASPTMPSLRYFWLAYPKRPAEITQKQFDSSMIIYLQQHIFVLQAMFPETLVLGICVPNPDAEDTAIFTVLHDSSGWTEHDLEEARYLQERLGILQNLEPHTSAHIK